MSGTIEATALAQVTTYGSSYPVIAKFKDTAHGIAAGSELFITKLKAADYTNDILRTVVGVATDYMEVTCAEGFTAGTPAGTETWCAGYVYHLPYLLIGFKLHLSAAEASGETLTLTVDANRGPAWDDLLLSKPMIGVTDLLWFPDEPIPMNAKDIIKFSWATAGNKTWGLEIITEPCA